MIDIDQVARQINDTADAFQRAGGDQSSYMLRDISRRVTEISRLIDATEPLMRAAAFGDETAMRAAWADHTLALHDAHDRAVYCPYDSDRCHDTDYCHCPNCTQHRKDYP